MAEDISAYEKNSIFVIKELSHKLKTTVKSVMQKSGAIEAIEYCNIAALDLTEEVAIDSALVLKRTSLKYRNNHNAPKLIEKYNNLAREALSVGDKILSENYFQHADHFMRVIEDKNRSRNQNKVDLVVKQVEQNNNVRTE